MKTTEEESEKKGERPGILWSRAGDAARLRGALQLLGEVCPEIWTDDEEMRKYLSTAHGLVRAMIGKAAMEPKP